MKRLIDILKLQSVRISLLYVLFSALWIIFTDKIVEQIFQDPALITEVQTYKGWMFVTVSGLFLFWFIHSAGRELERNRNFYKTMLDDARIGIARMEGGRIISVNPAFQNILQIEKSRLLEEPFLNFFDPKKKALIQRDLKKLSFNEQKVYEIKFSLKSERKLWVQFNFYRSRDKNGEYYQIIVQDINARKTYQSYNDLLLQLILSLEPGMDFKSSLQRMLNNLCTELNWDYGLALTPGSDGRYKKQVSWYRLDPLLDEFDSRVDLYQFNEGEGLTGLTAQLKKTIWIKDVEIDDRYQHSDHAQDADLRTIVSIPIVLNDNVIAVIMLFNRLTLEEDPDLVKLLTAIGQDIASKLEKSREQDERRRLEQSLNFALKAANMATWDMDLESGEVIRSLNHHELFGLENAPKTWNVDDLMEMIIEEDRQKVYDDLINASTGKQEYNVEFRMKLNGKVKWFWSRGNLQQDEFGEPRRLTGVISDVTGKKKIEKELVRERELLESLYRTIPVMITIYRPDLSDFRVNKEFEKVIGWTNEEAQEADLISEVYPDPDDRKKVAEFMSNPGSGWMDFEIVTKSGETLYSTWTNIRLSDDTQIGIGLDITERKNYEIEIRNKERLLSEAQRVANLGTFTLDLQNGDATVSKELRRIFGFNLDEKITLVHWYNILHPDHREEVAAYLKKVVEENRLFDKEYKIQRQNDGVVRWVHGKGEIIQHEKDEPAKMIGTIQDIDDRKQIEEKLKQQKVQMQRAQDIANLGYWEFDLKSKTLSWSDMVYEIFGLNKESFELTTDNFHAMVHPEDLDKLNKNTKKNIKEGTSEITYRIFKENGEIVYVQERGENEKRSDGREVLTGTVLDITNLKKAELELEEERMRFQAAAGVVSDVVWDYDAQKNILWWNEGIETVFGYNREQVLNETKFWESRIYDEDRKKIVQSMREAETSDATEWHENYRFLNADGKPRYVEDSAIIIRNEDNELLRIIGAMVDVTEQKKAEDRIIGSIIEGSENERRRIAKELHDGLGQYLAAASMNLESTYDEIKEISGLQWEQYKKGLKLLDDAIMETRRMSQNLLPKAIEDFGLSLAVESLLDDLNDSTDIDIKYSGNISDLKLLENIELNMYRIIQEGVNNAIRHSNCTRLSVQLTADEELLGCTIEDNGSGFKLRTDKHNGLGLQSINNRVKSMAGEVEISSRLGKGTLISVIVPLKQL